MRVKFQLNFKWKITEEGIWIKTENDLSSVEYECIRVLGVDYKFELTGWQLDGKWFGIKLKW
jgi:hypothetical protein